MNQNILNHNKDKENGTINEELFNKSNNTDSLKDSFIKKAVDSYLDEEKNQTNLNNENDPEKTPEPPESNISDMKKKIFVKKAKKKTNNKIARSNDKTKKKSKQPNDNANNINKNYKKEEQNEKGEREKKINEEQLDNMIKKVNESIKKMIEENQSYTDDNIYTLLNYLRFNVYLNIIKSDISDFFINECFDKSKWEKIFEKYIKLDTLPKNEEKEILNTIKNVLKINDYYTKSYNLLIRQPFQFEKYIIEKYYKNEKGITNHQIRGNSVFNVFKGLINNLKIKSNIMEIDEDKNEHSNMSITNNDVINKEEKLNFDLFNNRFSDNNINIYDEMPQKNDSTRNSTNIEAEGIKKENRMNNLSKRLKSMIKDAFFEKLYECIPNIKETFEKEKANKIENKNKIKTTKYIKKELIKQTDEDFWNSNFTEIINDLEINIKGNEEALKLVSKTKKDFLQEIMEDEEREKKFFEIEENNQKQSYKNLKYKNIAIQIFEDLNMDGVIILTKLITIEQGQYIKIKNPEEFESVIKSEFFKKYNFNVNLTKYEKNNIKERIIRLKIIAKNPISYLNKKRKRNKSK